MIRLQILGATDLRHTDGPEIRSVLAQPKRFALLAWLALCSTRGFVRRDLALALFWPEHDATHGRAALSRALYYLRKALGEGVILSRGDEEIGLSAHKISCDAVAFEGAIAGERYREALELWRGNLLEGFFVSDASGFEQWLERERDRLRSFACRAAWALTDAEQERGNAMLAAGWAQRAVDLMPYDEPGVQRLMMLLHAAGDRAGAMHVYERFAQRIASDLELTPSEETQGIANGLRTAEPAADVPAVHTGVSAERPDAGRHLAALALPRLRRFPAKLGLASAGVIVALGAAAWLLEAPRPGLEPGVAGVEPFRNRTGDPANDELARMATAWTREAVEDVAIESNGAPDPSNATADPQTNRATVRVTGTISGQGAALYISAVIRTPRGQKWAIGDVATTPRAPAGAIHEVRQRVAGGIAALRNPVLESWFPLATAPPTLDAYNAFAEALALARPEQRRDALALFQRAAAIDTTFTWTLLHTVTLHRSDYDTVSASAVLRLVDGIRDRIPPLQRHWRDWLAWRYRDPIRAYHAIRSAAALAPERFLAEFAAGARMAHRPREAAKLLENEPAGGYAHGSALTHASMLAQSYHELGEHRRELRVARNARQLYPDNLQALSNEVSARAALGQPDHVLALLDSALSFPDQGSDYAPGMVMHTAASELAAHKYRDAARQALKMAAAWHRSEEARDDSAERYRWNFAETLYLAGCLAESEQERDVLLIEADSLFRMVAANPVYSLYIQGSLGAIAARRGDHRAARLILDSLRNYIRSTRQPSSEAYFSDATIRSVLGDADSAIVSLRQWIGGQGIDLHTNSDFELLTQNSQFREFVRPKG